MNNQDLLNLNHTLRNLHRNKSKDREAAKKTISLVTSLLSKVNMDEDVLLLMNILAGEYSWYGMHDAEQEVLEDIVKRFPDDPVSWISFAEFMMYVKEDINLAEQFAQKAIDVATMKGDFIRHAHNTYCRTLVKQEKYSYVDKELEFLISFKVKKGSMDVACENDFIKNIPYGEVDPHLIDTLNALCNVMDDSK